MSGNGNSGQMTNATRTASGRHGRALSFNGATSIVSVADAASLDLTTGMTLSAWVRPTQLSGWRTVMMKERASELELCAVCALDRRRDRRDISQSPEIPV